MNFSRVKRRNSQDSYLQNGASTGKAQLWQRRSFNSCSDAKSMANAAMTFGTLPRLQTQVNRSRSNSLVDYTDVRTTVSLEKQDNETFGFEIQTYGLRAQNTTLMEMYTFISSVQQDSPAERAGLTVGDIIVTVNGVCTEGSAHQCIVDLIRECTNFLTIETVGGTAVKMIELDRKLRQLKKSLREKCVELRALMLRERHLTGGNLNDCLSLDSAGSVASPGGRSGLRFSSDSSCRSYTMEDGEDASVFEDPSPRSPTADDACFFPADFPLHPPQTSLCRTRSVSQGSSCGSLSPRWDLPEASSPFGTVPRRLRQGSVRKRFLKFIPGLHHSLEEE
ncbi:cytohesin-interacting protein-like [Brienomyrus brachyistius]|uniref:cytohesin-interacting protein-like n=1 Tax=Brienomyrus brachyistius TaxID=42636 RepID=UPI0020B4380F|nr:cytohesin-interacting protein-like [Brienomyrus brachyistius]